MRSEKKKRMGVRTGIFVLITVFVCIPLSSSKDHTAAISDLPERLAEGIAALFK